MPHSKPTSNLKLLLLQSGICLAVILLALVLRFAGGTIFEDIRAGFRSAVEDGRLLSSFSDGTQSTTTTTSGPAASTYD